MRDRLVSYPLFVGGGSTSDLLFRAGGTSKLELTGTRTLTNGIVILSYEFSKIQDAVA
jgi:hypothetical protein